MVLGVGIVFLGLLWAVLSHEGAMAITVSPTLHAEAWPKRDRPYLLLFYDPLCPVCRRLEADIEKDPAVKEYIRYVPAFLHQGSYETWLTLLVEWGWEEPRARGWLERMRPEVERSGLSVTPTAHVVGLEGERTVVGYPGYQRWRWEVLSALGVSP